MTIKEPINSFSQMKQCCKSARNLLRDLWLLVSQVYAVFCKHLTKIPSSRHMHLKKLSFFSRKKQKILMTHLSNQMLSSINKPLPPIPHINISDPNIVSIGNLVTLYNKYTVSTFVQL